MFEWMIRSTPEARTKGEKRGLKVLSTLNEYQARLFVADKALDWGRGGISRLSQLTGMSRTTITKAVQELEGRRALGGPPEGGARRPGGGRKKLVHRPISSLHLALRVRARLQARCEHRAD